MQPLRGNSRDAQDFGEGMRPPVNQLHTTAGLTYLGAESALYSAAHLPQRAATHMQWLPRVPATVRAAHAVLAQAAPQGMTSLGEGYRDQAVPST